MAGHRREIDELLAFELARGKTLQAAAQAVGCGERTVRRRWANSAFRRRVAELRQEVVGQSIGLLVASLNEAVATIRQLMVEAESEAVRFKAAVALIENGFKAAALDRLEERIAELETAIKARG